MPPDLPRSLVIETPVFVVVQFYPWFEFYFPLFWGMRLKQREVKFKPKIKLNQTGTSILFTL